MSDIKSWIDKLDAYDTPLLNHFQRFGYSFKTPNLSPAIIGHTKPSHPRLARLLLRPVRVLFRASEIALHAAGYTKAEDVPYDQRDIYDNCDCDVRVSGGGFMGLAQRLGSIRLEWSKTEPIYDEAKVAEIKAKFKEDNPNYGRMTWGTRTP